ncbi:MAG: PQQ-binding-like beta-propeller repeat protein, partial [Longimicrobiales bacterium]
MSTPSKRTVVGLALAGLTLLSTHQQQQGSSWRYYGGDPGGARYAQLRQITPANVQQLQEAWRFSTGETGASFRTPRDPQFEATPIVIDGTLYFITPLGRVFALDANTGQQKWVYDAQVPRLSFGDFASRGVSYWQDARAQAGAVCSRRIIAATLDARLVALDAGTGRLCAGFGDNGSGVINLREGLRNAPFETEEYEVTSPPVVYRDLVIVGSAVADNNRTDAASGEVRAFDARNGQLRWAWDPVPQDASDPQYRSWVG